MWDAKPYLGKERLGDYCGAVTFLISGMNEKA